MIRIFEDNLNLEIIFIYILLCILQFLNFKNIKYRTFGGEGRAILK